MADINAADAETISINDEDEIKGLNEKLLELLKTPPSKIIDIQRVRSLSGTYSPDNVESDNHPDAYCCEPSSALFHYKYDYTFLHQGSPVNAKNLPHYLLPIGVFWDIENCPVPRGKSAAAVAQVIRDKFFDGYREAEFIVVCDVYKENKQVIQELNDAQVNLIHVAATYKNAADEKLKQSIRRFADIHGSPAAIILISSDINFAADLSDLRHRKKMHVILLHNENSSEALILCANEHYNFMELMEPLPSRAATRATESYDVLVSNLPKDKGLTVIKRRLKQLSDNCGGRVIGINSNAAIIRFGLQEAADRAQKRMDGEFVFDTKITVRSLKEKNNRKIEDINTTVDLSSEIRATSSSPVQMYNANSAFAGVRSLPGTPQCHSSSPVIGAFAGWNGVHCAPINTHPGIAPSAPMFVGRSYSANGDIIYNRPCPEMIRGQSPIVWQVSGNQQYGRCWEDNYKNDRTKGYGKRNQLPQARDNNGPPNGGNRTPDGMRRIRGAQNTMNHHQDWNKGQRPSFCAMPMNSCNSVNFARGNTMRGPSPTPMYTTQGREVTSWNGHGYHGPHPGRNARTPSPYTAVGMQQPHQSCRMSPYEQTEVINDDVEKFFNPINNRGTAATNGSYLPIELQVTNLDQNIEPKEMKRILYAIFMEHVMVLHVSIFMQSDGNYAATVKVASLPDAQYAISQLHRRKIGYKRILISYAHTGGPNPQLIRSQIVLLLQEVPGHKLPLFKFREMYESRFMISISVSELYKMKDVCIVTEDPDGRMVSLNPDHRNTPSPSLGNISQDGQTELPYCIIHTQKPWSDKGWAEQEVASLPNIFMSLEVLRARISQLLSSHNGSMPLPTLPNCYEAEFKTSLENDENGVPLEHLISCLPSVELTQGISTVKYLTWAGDKTHDDSHHDESRCCSPALANQLALFSRELVDLLKTAPHCQIPFNRFIPAYHHHFGRQCRVADYGFTKLIDLLEALTHTIQVMGEGNKRVVTLSHRAQVRRFTSDLLRVLKAQASKQITLSEFPTVYARVIAKAWNVTDYGVCEINDILKEVSENTVVVTELNGNDKVIAIPKREQTQEEKDRTTQFAAEVVELLRHAPQCTMLFNKFVPSYHHHFGHQCRVSDYGFTKLIELFESIPHVVKIEDNTSGEDRRITLTEHESLRVVGEQLGRLILKNQNAVLLSDIGQYFLRLFGYMLRPELYGCVSMQNLIEKFSDTLKIIESPTGPTVVLVDKTHLHELGLQCRRILMDQSQQRLPVTEFQRIYNQYYNCPCDLNEIKQELTDVVKFYERIDEEIIELTPLQRFTCNIYRVLMKHGGKINFQQFESAYLNLIGTECKVAQYGFPSLYALLQALPCTVIIKESRQKKKTIFLNKKLAKVGIELPSTLPSPHRNRTSSNDSNGSDSFRVNGSNSSSISDKWSSKATGSTWSQGGNNVWQTDDHYWTNYGIAENLPNKWATPGGKSSFLRNFMAPHNESKSYSSPENDDLDNEYKWKSSVWATPPKYTRDVVGTNVDVPPLTLPPWNQIDDDHTASDLLSPTKNLLPAAANPLNPPTSPFFSVHDQVVIAPHPSQLPHPSSLSAKRVAHSTMEKKDDCRQSRLLGNSLEVHSPTCSEYYSISEGDTSDQLNTTPSKRIFGGGKRRLAAQFNQSMD